MWINECSGEAIVIPSRKTATYFAGAKLACCSAARLRNLFFWNNREPLFKVDLQSIESFKGKIKTPARGRGF